MAEQLVVAEWDARRRQRKELGHERALPHLGADPGYGRTELDDAQVAVEDEVKREDDLKLLGIQPDAGAPSNGEICIRAHGGSPSARGLRLPSGGHEAVEPFVIAVILDVDP